MSKVATRIAFGEKLAELIVKKPEIVVLYGDVAGSVKTDLAAKACPERCFDIGIAEENMMSIAAGLAASGKTVFAATYAVFATGRAFEQIRQSIAYPHLNVKICGTHTGVATGPDGASHQAVLDVALMRALPGMVVIQPADDIETAQAVAWAAEYKGPVYLRLGRGGVERIHDENYRFDLKKADVLHKGKDIALFASGGEVQQALKAAEILRGQNIDPTVVNVPVIKPLDEDTLLRIANGCIRVFTVEDHVITGGLGSAVAEMFASHACPARLHRIGLQDRFGESGEPDQLLEKFGLSGARIAAQVAEVLK